MTVTTVDKDVEALTMTLVADFDAPVERVWQLWADPRQLERWWGPPSHPATVERHELAPGGTVTYFMTGPEGERYHGLWHVTAVDAPTSLSFEDAFADDSGAVNTSMPQTRAEVTLSAHDGGTRMQIRSQFASREQMDQLLEMGMAEGIQQAISQIPAILAE
jgi:uncharacterized protein YndB with AHSA1/START domain